LSKINFLDNGITSILVCEIIFVISKPKFVRFMLKQKEQFVDNIFAAISVVLSVICLFIAYYVRQHRLVLPISSGNEYNILIAVLIPTWFLLLRYSGFSRLDRVRSYAVIFFELCIVIATGLALLFLFIFSLKLDDISRIVVFVFGIVNLTVLYFFKIAVLSALKRFRRKGFNTKNIMIIADENSDEIIDKIIHNTFWGYIIKVIITDSEKIIDQYINSYPVLPSNTNIDKFLEIETIDEVIYCRQEFSHREIKRLIYSCQEIGVTFCLQSQLHSMIAAKSYMSYFGEIPFFTFSKTPTNYFALKTKTIFDFFFALFVILITSPILIVIALIIKLTSKGPIVFKQKRVGLRGRHFNAFKFRTMVQNAEELKEKLLQQNEQQGPVFKIKNDPRVTKIGRFLRKTSLDEFPQFFNVLFGDMSIVGPRPPIPKEVEQYERWQLRRLSMKPGITCIWQVSGRNNIPFDEWMKLDLQYIDSWSLKLDFILILKTVRVMLTGDGQ